MKACLYEDTIAFLHEDNSNISKLYFYKKKARAGCSVSSATCPFNGVSTPNTMCKGNYMLTTDLLCLNSCELHGNVVALNEACG
jgi:hypothetical protein